MHLTQHGHRWKRGILDLFFLSHNATRHGHGLAAVLRSRESGGRGKRHAIVNQDGKTCRNTDLIMLQPPSMFSQAGSKSQFGSRSIERVVIFGKETVTNLSESPIILEAEALRKLYKSLLKVEGVRKRQADTASGHAWFMNPWMPRVGRHMICNLLAPIALFWLVHVFGP